MDLSDYCTFQIPSSNWPCDLLTVIPNAGFMGNCFKNLSNGDLALADVKTIRSVNKFYNIDSSGNNDDNGKMLQTSDYMSVAVSMTIFTS